MPATPPGITAATTKTDAQLTSETNASNLAPNGDDSPHVSARFKGPDKNPTANVALTINSAIFAVNHESVMSTA